MDNLVSKVRFDRWLLSDVCISSSVILIFEAASTLSFTINEIDQQKLIAECPLQYLSFLGIGNDTK